MSLLWVTASGYEMVPAHEFATYFSLDNHAPMGESMSHMQRFYDDQKREHKEEGYDPDDFEDMVHPGDYAHGGPRGYVDHLKKDIAENGQREPIEVYDGKPEMDIHHVVEDGHHRGVALMELGHPVKVKRMHVQPDAWRY